MESQEVPLPMKPGTDSYSAPNCPLDWRHPLLRNQEERGQKQDRGFSCRTKVESPRHRLTGTESGKGQEQLQHKLSSKSTGHWDTELRLEDKGSSCKLLAREPNEVQFYRICSAFLLRPLLSGLQNVRAGWETQWQPVAMLTVRLCEVWK